MPLRRPPDRSAVERVERLLAPPRIGWVPPPEDEPVTDVLVETPPEPAPEADRSWAPGREPRVPSRLRLDPGRPGAVVLVLAAALAAVVASAVVLQGRPQEVGAPILESSGVPLPGVSAAPEASGVVVVAVAGKVHRPGLVRLPAGSRVDDALRAAGGATDAAAVGLLNLARRLVDGEQVLVGVDPPPGQPAAGAPAAGGGLLDLNAATAADLEALPGIGPVLAQRIVDWRTANGPFASVDQLREVTGIGEAKYDDLHSKVVVR